MSVSKTTKIAAVEMSRYWKWKRICLVQNVGTFQNAKAMII